MLFPMMLLTIRILFMMITNSSLTSKLTLVIATLLIIAYTTINNWPNSNLVNTISSIVLAIWTHLRNDAGSSVSLAVAISYLILGGACSHFLTAYQPYLFGMILLTGIPASLITTPNDHVSRVTSLSLIFTSAALCLNIGMICTLSIAFMFSWLSMAAEVQKTSTNMGSSEALIAIGTLTISIISNNIALMIPMLIISLYSVSLVTAINGQVETFLRYLILFSGLLSLQVYIWTCHLGPFTELSFKSFGVCQSASICLPLMCKLICNLLKLKS